MLVAPERVVSRRFSGGTHLIMTIEQRAAPLASRAAFLRAEADAMSPRRWLDPLTIAMRRRAAELELLAVVADRGQLEQQVA